jgi:hypothetical protein
LIDEESAKIDFSANLKLWRLHIMPTMIEQISSKLPQTTESILQEVLEILDSAHSDEESSESEIDKIRNHSAFLNGYAPEDEGLYDDYIKVENFGLPILYLHRCFHQFIIDKNISSHTLSVSIIAI